MAGKFVMLVTLLKMVQVGPDANKVEDYKLEPISGFAAEFGTIAACHNGERIERAKAQAGKYVVLSSCEPYDVAVLEPEKKRPPGVVPQGTQSAEIRSVDRRTGRFTPMAEAEPMPKAATLRTPWLKD